MIRLFLTCLILFLSGPVLAQSPPVVVKSELAAESTMVGQPLILRVTVLVPTWLPEPPRFPSLEMPDVIVRLPSRASSPVSERIDGETWSGVSRAYRLYPMIPGAFTLTPQPVGITYADPGTRAPISLEVALDPVRFEALVPNGAEGLDPLILAESFALEQAFESVEDVLAQGDAATRIVTAKIGGTSALFIPPLTPNISGDLARAYPRDPVVRETEATRGGLSGSRTEATTYVAQFGGALELPAISVDWYNIKTKQVETAHVEGATLQLDAPPPPERPALSLQKIAFLIGVVGIFVAGLWGLKRYALPPLRARLKHRRAIWLNSEAHAAREVKRAIGSHDLTRVYRALAMWSARCPGQEGQELETALALVGRARYKEAAPSTGSWAVLSAAFQADRDRRLRLGAEPALPPLNAS